MYLCYGDVSTLPPFFGRARGWRGVTHGLTTEQVMDVWLFLTTVFTGCVLGQILGIMHQTFNDIHVFYTHSRDTNKEQWIVLVYCLCFVRVSKCDNRYDANVVFARLRGPRIMVDTHKRSSNGQLREVLYGGRVNAWVLGRMRRRIN